MDAETKRLVFDAEIKADEDGGMTFTGLASTFGNADMVGDIVVEGAFERSLKRRKPKGVKMLWQHNMDQPIGVFTDMREEKRGLVVEGQLAETQLGREAHELLKLGAIDSMSIGFRTIKDEMDNEKNKRKLIEVDLLEVSLVTFPANPKAKIRTVKEMSQDGDHTGLKRLAEKLLRDGGFSHTAAKDIVFGGYKDSDPRDEAESIEWLRNLRGRMARFAEG